MSVNLNNIGFMQFITSSIGQISEDSFINMSQNLFHIRFKSISDSNYSSNLTI